ncbi:hypothetical protein [Winogradskyella forsetii]|uniref:hypothetical protein n=1 Tax=Winogradskyella forsetii TaxID=2686077 RepID=UPI0015B800A2|nr:hypothetical protein [Winogradskyella forsetii]
MRLTFIETFFYGCLFILFSCEVPFEDNARLLVKGRVLDENNQPISDADIAVSTREGEGFIFGTDLEFLGDVQSASDGTFEIITLFGRDQKFVVDVFIDNDYTSYRYITDTEFFTPTDYTIDLGVVPIKRKADFNFNITRTSPPDIELQYTLEYMNNFCSEVYVDEQLDEDQTNCYETQSFGGILNNNNPNTSTQIQSFIGAEVTFSYSINGQVEESQTITIDQSEYDFNFNY